MGIFAEAGWVHYAVAVITGFAPRTPFAMGWRSGPWQDAGQEGSAADFAALVCGGILVGGIDCGGNLARNMV